MEQSQQICSLQALQHFKGYILTYTLYHISRDLIHTCSLSILKLCHSHTRIIIPNLSLLIISQYQPSISILYSTGTLQLSSIHLTHLLPKQFLISTHILIYLPSKLYLFDLLALIYTPFNLFIFLFVNFQTYFLCNFIPSTHATSFLSTAAFPTSFQHTLFRFFSPHPH